MRKESYLKQPLTVELHEVDTGTDIILRKDITQVEKEKEFNEIDSENHSKNNNSGEETATYTVWECEEVQHRYKGSDEITKESVTEKFDYWWGIAEGKDEIDATDEQAKKDGTPTVMERLEALENGIVELAEVLCNG